LFGHGLGATAFSDFPKRTDATSTEYIVDIPVFHDSSLFIRLKFGYIGLAIWILFWVRIFAGLYSVSGSLAKVGEVSSRWLLFGSLLTVVAIYCFSHGFPLMRNPGYTTIIIGYLLGSRRWIRYREMSMQKVLDETTAPTTSRA
jgi:hypothetical protein